MNESPPDEGLTGYGRLRRWALTAPWWQLAVINGLFAGVVFGLLNALMDPGDGPVAGLPAPVFDGLYFGLIMGPLLAWFGVRQRRRVRAATGGATPGQVIESTRAAFRGPVPADPEARRVAYDLARHQLDELRRRRAFALVTFGFFTALSVVLALTDDPWFWLIALMFAGFLGWAVWLPGHLRRRIELLRPDAASEPGPAV
jgi:hypothetical protein